MHIIDSNCHKNINNPTEKAAFMNFLSNFSP